MRTKPRPKHRYRLRNWPEYTAARRQRGSLTLWCDAAALAGWVARGRSGRRGRPRTYSDAAIACMLTLQQLFRLSLSGTVGFERSLLGLLGHGALPVAVESTLCRRRRALAVAARSPSPCRCARRPAPCTSWWTRRG